MNRPLIANRRRLPLWVMEGAGMALGGMVLMVGATTWLLTGHPPTSGVDALVDIAAVGMCCGQSLLVLGGCASWIAARGQDW
jgi:hypothetical protein